MPWGAATVRWIWCVRALVVCGALLLASGRGLSAQAEESYEIMPLGTDPARNVDRYQITLGPGASLWEVGFNRLPLISIEQGDSKVVEIVEQSFRAAYPERGPNIVRPGDIFVLEVPTGTFVSKAVTRQPDRTIFDSYAGDQLTTFPKDSIVQYRLRHADTPDKVDVLVQGGQSDPVDEAKKIYDIDQPDFLQVRQVRGALQERTSKITVDTNRRYLDDFRAVRDRATRVEDSPSGLKTYFFDPADQEVQFVRVDDGVGDQTDPANFPRIFRTAYYRDGTVRKYVITEPGDSTGALGQPDSEIWRRTLSTWQEWLPGQAEALPPFAPAISNAGALQPGRILVLAFRPRTAQPSPRPSGAVTPKGSGVDCMGLPLGMILIGGVLAVRRRGVY
jgi:hypothetical protein